MQSTGHASTQAVSFVPMQGSAITYAMRASPVEVIEIYCNRCWPHGRARSQRHFRPFLASTLGPFLSKLLRCRNRIQTAPGKHILKQCNDFLIDDPVRGEHFPAIELERAAIKTSYRAAGFEHQQRPGGGIPGIEVEFPVTIHAAACGVCQIERSRSGAANAMRAQRDLVVEVDVRILVAGAAGKSGGQQAFRQIIRTRYLYFLSIQIRAFSLLRDEELIARGIVDYASDQCAVFVRGQSCRAVLKAERYAEYRKAMREICRAIQRIDIPAILAVELIARSFFAVNAMVRKMRVHALDDQLFRGAVSYGDKINIGLVFGGDAAVIEIANERSCFKRYARSGTCELQGYSGWEFAHFCSPSGAVSCSSATLRAWRRREPWRLVCSVMVRI